MTQQNDSSVHCYRRHHLAAGFLALVFATSGTAATPDARASHAAAVTLGGEVSRTLPLNAAALAKMRHVEVKASVHGVKGTRSGVPLDAIL